MDETRTYLGVACCCPDPSPFPFPLLSLPLPLAQVTLEWVLSGTWPLPYRPRVAAVGSSVLTIDPSATIVGQPMVRNLQER